MQSFDQHFKFSLNKFCLSTSRYTIVNGCLHVYMVAPVSLTGSGFSWLATGDSIATVSLTSSGFKHSYSFTNKFRLETTFSFDSTTELINTQKEDNWRENWKLLILTASSTCWDLWYHFQLTQSTYRLTDNDQTTFMMQKCIDWLEANLNW